MICNCIAIGKGASAIHSNSIVIGDNMCSKKEGDIVVGAKLFGFLLHPNLTEVIEKDPNAFRSFIVALSAKNIMPPQK